MTPIKIILSIVGGLFLLFAPGFAWSYIFFHQKELNWVERIVLSFGLSIVLMTLSVFALSKITGMPINLISSLVIILSLIAVAVILIILRQKQILSNKLPDFKKLLANIRKKSG